MMLVLGDSLLLYCCYWHAGDSMLEGETIRAGVSLLAGVRCIVVVVIVLRRLRSGVFVEL